MTGRASPVNDLFAARSQLSEAFFRRIAIGYAHIFPLTARRVIEFGFLLQAFFVLCVFVYLHYMFVRSPITCLDKLRSQPASLEIVGLTSKPIQRNHYAPGDPNTPNEPWPRYGILRVEVIRNPKPSYTLEDSYAKEFLGNIVDHGEDASDSPENEASIPNYNPSPGLSSTMAQSPPANRFNLWFFNMWPPWGALDTFLLSICKYYREIVERLVSLVSRAPKSPDPPQESAATVLSPWDWKHGIFFDTVSHVSSCISSSLVHISSEIISWIRGMYVTPHEENYIIEYALEHGFLRLSTAARKRLNITVKLVVLDPDVDECFGGPVSRFLMEEFLGYDDLLLGSIKHLASSESVKGHMANVVTGQHYRLVSSQMSRSSYLVATLVMLLFTFCVSTILRYSTHQLVLVIADILQLFETNVSIGIPATPFMTVILALVAIETIMSEFFGDSFTAFYVILIVSICDHYEAFFCRTEVSRRYWPRFFYLYHFAFYAYHYRFNGQFSNLALWVSWLFIIHSMIYFFHHYELPNLLSDWELRDFLTQIDSEDQVGRRVHIRIRQNFLRNSRAFEVIRGGDDPILAAPTAVDIRDDVSSGQESEMTTNLLESPAVEEDDGDVANTQPPLTCDRSMDGAPASGDERTSQSASDRKDESDSC